LSKVNEDVNDLMIRWNGHSALSSHKFARHGRCSARMSYSSSKLCRRNSRNLACKPT